MDKEQKLSVLSFSLFSSWLLSFLFEGQVLRALLNLYELETEKLNFGTIGGILVGLVLAGFFIKTLEQARITITISLLLSITTTIAFFFPPSIIWYVSLFLASLAAGSYLSAWGFYYKFYIPSNKRLRTLADVLIYSNLLMIIINMIAIHTSLCLGIALSIAALLGALYYNSKLSMPTINVKSHDKSQARIQLAKPLMLLCLYIFLISINSGLMYQVINPAFEHHLLLFTCYWALPYIATIYLIKSLPEKINRNYILYLALSMIGLSFTVFTLLDRSARSYLIVNTLMLAGYAVYDLFYWSILGEMLNYHSNPAKILGVGLSSNLLGILIGSFIREKIDTMDSVYGVSLLAFIIVFLAITILPILDKYLSKLLKNHMFLGSLSEIKPDKKNEAIKDIEADGKLTQRESEILLLLLRGRTYKMISDELDLSQNTVKFHIKNIYSKFQVKSKSELMKSLTEKGYLPL